MSDQERHAQEREDLATATRILGRHQMIGMFGHVSLLTDDPELYLICPGAGKRKDLCRPEDLHLLNFDDEFGRGLPLELYMHAQMHKARPEIKSLIHVHTPALTALSSMAEVPSDLLMIHASFWPENMPIWDKPDLVRNHKDGAELVEIMGDEVVSLLRWHGAVIVGHTLKEAVFRAVLAEAHANQVLTAMSHGREIASVPDSYSRPELYSKMLPPQTHEMHWHYESGFVQLDEQ